MMQIGHELQDQVRSLFKVRAKRQLAPVGPKPKIGALIVRGEIRMSVQAGMSDPLWDWLLMHGWREPTVWPDRRQYRDVPPSQVTRLFDAQPEDWAKILGIAVSRAVMRRTLNRGRSWRRVLPAGKSHLTPRM